MTPIKDMTVNKPVFCIQSPLNTRSGYGERSRDLIRAIIALDRFDVKLISTRWGSTPMNVLKVGEDDDLLSRIVTQLTSNPDIFMQITVPNEFNPIGKYYNIGVTAGIETNLPDGSWIEGINRMDITLVSSNHAKLGFESAVYEKRDTRTNQPIGQLRVEKPIEVLFEGIRLDKFGKTYNKSQYINELFQQIPEQFCFLFTGMWLQGVLGEDRKNVGGMVKIFLETFKGVKNAPALVLKTTCGVPSVMDRNEIIARVEEVKAIVGGRLPNVYVVYGDLTDAEMNDLYNHPNVKVHLNFGKGEGYGRPLAEAALTNKPIIASGWSGHLDFLHPDHTVLIGGELKAVHPSAVVPNMILKEAAWFDINQVEASAALKDVWKNYSVHAERSRKSYHYMKTNFSFDNMQALIGSILDRVLPVVPVQQAITLPKLKRVS